MSEQETPKRRPGNPNWKKGVSGNPTGRARADAVVDTTAETTSLSVADQELLASIQPTKGKLMHRTDGWQSAITSIGTIADKRTSHTFRAKRLTYMEQVEMWRGDPMCQKAIEMVPEYIFSTGYDINFGTGDEHDDLKHDVFDQLEALCVDDAIKRAMSLERGVGGSAILLGVKDGRAFNEPMDPDTVQSLDWLTVLEPIEIMPFSSYQSGPKQGEPEQYQLAAYSTSYSTMFGFVGLRTPPSITTTIHESRLIVFPGNRVSRFQRTQTSIDSSWGDALTIRFYEALRDFNLGMAAVGIIVTDFSQPVIGIENLISLVLKNDAGLVARMKAIELGRSVANAILLDTKETYNRVTTNVSGLSDLTDRLAMRLGADIDVPLSVLLGLTSKSLGIDPAVELELFKDRIRSDRRQKTTPKLKQFINLIIKTLRKRGAPKRYSIAWNSLTHQTDKDKADLGLAVARTASMLIKSGIATPDEVRKAIYTHRFNVEPLFDARKEAPGFFAPPPHGTPGSPTNPGGAGPVALNAHPVGGYVRKNPTSSGTEPAAKEGGNHAPGGGPNSKKDAGGQDAVEFDTEDAYVAFARQRLVDAKATPTVKGWVVLDQMWRTEYQDHQSGACDEADCPFAHPIEATTSTP